MKALIAVFTASFLLAGCGGGDGDTNGDTDGTAAGCLDVSTEESPVVVALDNEFDPACLEVSAGQDLTVQNNGEAAHTFTIEEAGINLVLQPGDEQLAEGVGDAVQEGADTTFVCEFHPEMVGTLKLAEG